MRGLLIVAIARVSLQQLDKLKGDKHRKGSLIWGWSKSLTGWGDL